MTAPYSSDVSRAAEHYLGFTEPKPQHLSMSQTQLPPVALQACNNSRTAVGVTPVWVQLPQCAGR
jgi:hypothetical protein